MLSLLFPDYVIVITYSGSMTYPEKPQLPVTNLADERIARKTPFGPMSAYRPDPENRIKNNSVTGKEVKPAPPALRAVRDKEDK